MRVLRARTAGFCMGVALALQTLDRALKEKAQEKKAPAERRIITYGPIIHNPQVLELYERLGVIRTEDMNAVRAEDIVVIRAHGVPRDDERRLLTRGAVIRDATCPRVKRAQVAIAEVTAGGRTLLLFGEADHPEVKGLVSYAGGLIHIFDSLDALRGLDLPPGAYALAAQTTQDQGEFSRICDWARAQLGKAGETPVLRTICDATSKRQDEVLALAERVEVMIVVGGKESGNTRRLAALAAGCGVPTWHVESPDELPLAALRDKRTAGLTAGASTPKALIDQTEIWLERM